MINSQSQTIVIETAKAIIFQRTVLFNLPQNSQLKSIESIVRAFNSYDGSALVILEKNGFQKINHKLYSFRTQIWKYNSQFDATDILKHQALFQQVCEFVVEKIRVLVKSGPDLRKECHLAIKQYVSFLKKLQKGDD